MDETKKAKSDARELVAGRVDPAIKGHIPEILRLRKIRTESEYVRRAVTAQVRRDLSQLGLAEG